MLVSIVVPLYNEEEIVSDLYARLHAVADELQNPVEILFVNDGSTDSTLAHLLRFCRNDKRVKVLDLSRNFGHQAAITAGIDFARGDGLIIMDGDLQDPPELIPKMLDLHAQGFDVIYATRNERHGESFFKRASAKLFYLLMRKIASVKIPENTGDFRFMSRPVVDAFKSLREQHRFVRGMIGWLGFRQTSIVFNRPARQGGDPKYTFMKMLHFAMDSIFSFSARPLRFVTAFGFIALFCGLLYLIYNLYLHFIMRVTIPGWTSLMTLNICFSGAILIAVGVLGEYIARVYEEIKQRPLYIVRQAFNVPDAHVLPRAVFNSTEAEAVTISDGTLEGTRENENKR